MEFGFYYAVRENAGSDGTVSMWRGGYMASVVAMVGYFLSSLC